MGTFDTCQCYFLPWFVLCHICHLTCTFVCFLRFHICLRSLSSLVISSSLVLWFPLLCLHMNQGRSMSPHLNLLSLQVWVVHCRHTQPSVWFLEFVACPRRHPHMWILHRSHLYLLFGSIWGVLCLFNPALSSHLVHSRPPRLYLSFGCPLYLHMFRSLSPVVLFRFVLFGVKGCPLCRFFHLGSSLLRHILAFVWFLLGLRGHFRSLS